jgi:hypothetical protein
MATYSRRLLSGSTSGKPIKVAATATAGTLIHTAVAGDNKFDEVYLWVTNTDTVSRDLTIEWGGATDPDCLIAKTYPVPALSGPIPIVPGLSLNAGLEVRAFASSANKLLISGHCNAIS